jgi:5-methylcytosine-specific restriction endonuclease McrA
MVIPFTVEKIKRDLKWFSLEQIEKALDLFSKLGLVSTDKNGFISITNFSRLIGNETYGAAEKRSSLQAKKELAQEGKLVKISKDRYILPSGEYYYIDHVRYGGNGDKVLKRSNGLCEMCGSTDGIRIHHNNGYSNAPEDLVVLCYGCHGTAHSKPNNGRLKLPHKNEIERVKSEK